MPFVRIWIHIVFGTKRRECFLTREVKNKLVCHIKENAEQKDIFIDEVNGAKDHIHCLISLGVDQNISKVVQLIKGESSFWINKNKLTGTQFEWADEYFAVSVSESQIDTVRNYIRNQDEHHQKKNYTEEYNEFMKKYGFKFLG
ncbi:MAG: IS200/IS605 family transposase [Ignavibacteriaceae bacterium]|nr:IS200/IS605 family transposase [Ignavibacteriaceae bacterium]